MIRIEFESDGMHNGSPIYCPVNAYGDCPYCDQCNICHIKDPVEECDDFTAFFEDWEAWERADEYEEDPKTDEIMQSVFW